MMLRNVVKNTDADENPTSAAIALSGREFSGLFIMSIAARTLYSARTCGKDLLNTWLME